MSCVIGVKAVYHHPGVEHLGLPMRVPSVQWTTATAGRPDSGKTPGQAEGDRATADENLRRQRPGVHDKQGSGTRPGTAAKDHAKPGITDLPPAAEEAQHEEVPPRGSRKSPHHA